jgi:hypothetical protein
METTLLTIEQMQTIYPNQWLLVANPKTDENLETLEGEVIAHSADCEPIYAAIARERKTRTGTLSIESQLVAVMNLASFPPMKT